MTARCALGEVIKEGMPYQTLIASVLHKYVTSRPVDPEPPKRSA